MYTHTHSHRATTTEFSTSPRNAKSFKHYSTLRTTRVVYVYTASAQAPQESGTTRFTARHHRWGPRSRRHRRETLIQSLPSTSSSESRPTLPSSNAELEVADEQRSRIINMDAVVVVGVVGQVAARGLPGAEDLSEDMGSSPVEPSRRRHILSCRRPPNGGTTPEELLLDVGGEEEPGLDGGCATVEGG